jgi:hypothetical protein
LQAVPWQKKNLRWALGRLHGIGSGRGAWAPHPQPPRPTVRSIPLLKSSFCKRPSVSSHGSSWDGSLYCHSIPDNSVYTLFKLPKKIVIVWLGMLFLPLVKFNRICSWWYFECFQWMRKSSFDVLLI